VKNQLKTIFLLGVLSALLIGVGGMIGKNALYLFGALAVGINLVAFFFSDRIVLKMHGAKELPREGFARIHEEVEMLARRAGIPKPRLYLIEADYANAFATGRSPAKGAVAVTTGILRLLTPRELRGVLAHELAHIRNRDTLVATLGSAMAAVISYVANMLQFSALFGGSSEGEEEHPAGGLLVALLAPLVGGMLQFAVSRSREFLADETGAALAQDPHALADALEKLGRSAAAGSMVEPEPATASLFIVNPLSGGEAVAELFSTHPRLADRIRRLRAMRLSDLRNAA
jgi:heat shock protein HtpX